MSFKGGDGAVCDSKGSQFRWEFQVLGAYATKARLAAADLYDKGLYYRIYIYITRGLLKPVLKREAQGARLDRNCKKFTEVRRLGRREDLESCEGDLIVNA